MKKIKQIETINLPSPEQGFLGEGHEALKVFGPRCFTKCDPFILLMDDKIDIQDRAVGAPHPHAGFETVTLILDGKMNSHDESGEMFLLPGDLQWMTAGSGVIHTETIKEGFKTRALQLWLTLPVDKRWATPRSQNVFLKDIPIFREEGVSVRVYSGNFRDLIAQTKNYVPTTLLDISLEPYKELRINVPSNYNGFFYPIEGESYHGEEQKILRTGEVGWLKKANDSEVESEILITTKNYGTRIIYFAGQPQNSPIISYGPFIADNIDEIAKLEKAYRNNEMPHI